MAGERADVEAARFELRAAEPMAEMFDHVSARYELLNRILSLGRDHAWRQAMWREVPESARIVLDLCTGNGASLPGLRRAGRLVMGADVSLGMLSLAAEEQVTSGWGPRLLCSDAFRLPLGDDSVDAITIAFGMRNLRPVDQALNEMARVLKPGGALVVLEAAAPGAGVTAPFHRFYLRHVVPTVGRLSPDPSAYRYLSQSVLAFGAGPEFEQSLRGAGFTIERRRAFMMGATRLWSANRVAAAGQNAAVSPNAVRSARSPGSRFSASISQSEQERRVWVTVQLLLSSSLLASLVYAGWLMANPGFALPLPGWSRGVAWLLIGLGVVAFAIRTAVLLGRLRSGRPRS